MKHELAQDVRVATRQLVSRPGFSLTVLLTLMLGIGANSAIFTAVNAALIRPLPYLEPDRLVHLWETKGGDVSDRSEASYPDYLDWKAQRDVFAAIEGYDETNVTVLIGGEPLMLRGARTTAGFLSMLGVTPALGRLLGPDDAQTGGAPVVVLSHAFWTSRLAGAPSALGQTVSIDGRPFTVVGVLPAAFHFASVENADLWLPLDPAAGRMTERFNHWLNVVGRLRGGVSVDAASANLGAVMRRLSEQHPETNGGRGITMVPLREALVGDVRAILLALLGAAALVLLITCVNVAGLLLARGAARAHEMTVRAALGASRGRLVRQLVVESMLLAVAGGVLGVLFARVGVHALVAAIPDARRVSMPYLADMSVNRTVLLVTALMAVLTGLAFGIAPALSASRTSLADAMRAGGRGAVGRVRTRARAALVTAEIALTIVLLVGAGLMTRSLATLLQSDLGFTADRVLTARVALAGAAYALPERQQRFFEELMSRVRALPPSLGVRDVGAVTNLPLYGGGTNTYRVEGQAEPDAANRPESVMRGVAGDYFRAMGIRLVAGRTFSARDDSLAQPAIIMSESQARRLFGTVSPIGGRLRFYAFPDSAWAIIGVVADVKTGELDAEAPPTIYYSHLQAAENRLSLAVRTSGDPAAVAAAIRREVRALDPGLPVYHVATMAETIDRSQAVFTRRYPLLLIGAFALTAFLLAMVGVYGVISYSVERRTSELGLRVALGAQRGHVLGLVLRDGARMAAAGVVAGVLTALMLSRFIRSLLYGVSAGDPVTYVVAVVAIGSVAMLASAVPARRAARIDPMVALRRGE